MKVVMRALLAVAIVLLTWVCWKSIQGPIDFNAEVAHRDRAVIQRLMDIRTAQVAFRSQTGSYTADFDSLINFVKSGKIATLIRSGDLTEQQLEKGMTEEAAMKIINSGNVAKIKAEGLWDNETNAPQLVRDSLLTLAVEVLFPNRPNFYADSLKYVPFAASGTTFNLGVDSLKTASGYPIQVFESKVPYIAYLGDLDRKLLAQKIQEVLDRPGNRFPGMQVGSLEVANNNAGNWE